MRVLLARAESETGKFDEANKTLDTVVKEDPLNVDAWFALGKYSIMAGDSKRAVDDYLSLAQVKANRLDDERMQANVTQRARHRLSESRPARYRGVKLQAAIDMRKKLGDVEGEAVSLRNLATRPGAAG